MIVQPAFFLNPEPQAKNGTPPLMRQALSHLSLIQKMSFRFAYRPQFYGSIDACACVCVLYLLIFNVLTVVRWMKRITKIQALGHFLPKSSSPWMVGWKATG